MLSEVPKGKLLNRPPYVVAIISKNISSTIHLFADDYIVYQLYYNSKDDILKKNLENFQVTVEINFNVFKCVLLRVTRYHSQYANKMPKNPISNILSWNTHITTVTNQATRMLNLLKKPRKM